MSGENGLLSVLSRLRAGRGALAAATAGGIAECAGAVVAGGAVGWAVGAAASGTPAGGLVPAAVLAVVAVVVSAVGNWALAQFGHAFAFRAQADLRLQVFDGLERSVPAGVEAARTGDLATTVMDDVDALEGFFAHLGVGAVGAAVTGAAGAVALAVIDPWVALVAVAGMLLCAGVPLLLARRGRRRADELGAAVGAVNADVVDGVQGLRELVVFGGVDAWWERIARGSRSVRDLRRGHARATGAQAAVTDLLTAATVVGVLLVAVGLATAGTITLAAATTAVTVTLGLLGTVTTTVGTAGALAPLRASARRVLELIDQPEAVPDQSAGEVTLGDPVVRFSDVGFGYRPGRAVLRGLDLEVPAGATVALVGRSGAGKSTCAHLLLRFRDPDTGGITVGGHDLRAMPLAQLRRTVTVVAQDAHLFAGSVAENLRLGAPEATDADLEQAARTARVHDVVTALPQGYDTRVGERGARLSGGQRQRLTIARALLTEAPVLVLDEASSNLDAENEQLVTAALREARHGRTTLVIAHRPSTVRAADLVAVLDEGRVVELGTPAELAPGDGPYAELMTRRDEAAVGAP